MEQESLQRDSNAELLRIICMFFIVLHHFLSHAVFPDTMSMAAPLTSGVIASTFANGFLFVGVVCFVLISGYYGIRLHWRGVWRLFSMVVFYGLLLYLVNLGLTHQHLSYSIVTQSLLIFSHSWWWFLNCYVMLMCVSPLLNAGIEHLSKKQHLLLIATFTLMQVYFGFLWQTYLYDSDGFSFMNMMYLYVIGAYLHRYVTLEYISAKRWMFLSIYILSAILWGILTALTHRYSFLSWWTGFAYNNPVLIVSGVGLFLFVMSFHFSNRIINWLAAGVFAVYLVQESSKVKDFLYECINSICIDCSISMQFLITVFISVLFLLIILLFDRFRAFLMKPLDNLLFKYKD